MLDLPIPLVQQSGCKQEVDHLKIMGASLVFKGFEESYFGPDLQFQRPIHNAPEFVG